MSRVDTTAIERVRAWAHPLTGGAREYDALLAEIGDASLVLLGEASHGTHEFYQERAAITKRLIAERGFSAVAVEADWPDAYRVNRYVQGRSDDPDADAALGGFQRFPTWMWRNRVVLDFVEWLRARNDGMPAQGTTGFYGLDLYSLHASMSAVVDYLDRVDPAAARRARDRYACFEAFGEDSQQYGYATEFGLSRSCADEVVAQLVDLRRKAGEYANRDGQVAREEFFYAEQNARLVHDAEEYYRVMFRSHIESWNRRDRHMAGTLDALVEHLGGQGRAARVVVWEHNSHLGDARATAMGQRGELNVGQLARQRHGPDVVLVGFTTHRGTVTAASDWGAPAERKRVRPSREDSHERLLHEAGLSRFWLSFRGTHPAVELLRDARLERAIGVIYRPETERMSHYFEARLADQFDAVLHVDETTAVEPLEPSAGWVAGEPPETYPTGV